MCGTLWKNILWGNDISRLKTPSKTYKKVGREREWSRQSGMKGWVYRGLFSRRLFKWVVKNELKKMAKKEGGKILLSWRWSGRLGKTGVVVLNNVAVLFSLFSCRPDRQGRCFLAHCWTQISHKYQILYILIHYTTNMN